MSAWLKDTLERLIKTFVQAFLAQLTAAGVGLVESLADTSNLERAAVAGIAAALSLVFSQLSTWANSSKPPAAPIAGSPMSPASLVNG
jgi:hypothetical protein